MSSGGSWSNDWPIISNTNDIVSIKLTNIAAVNANPFGQMPIDSEVRWNDLNAHGALSPWLPSELEHYYIVGYPDNSPASFIIHAKLQKPAKQDQQFSVRECTD